MHEEGADRKQRDHHQQNPGDVRFNAIHGKQRSPRNVGLRRPQTRFVGHVIDRIETDRDQQRLQQHVRRRHADAKAEHQRTGQREAEEEGQQEQQREENVEVKANTAKLKPGQGANKQRRQQPDGKQPGKLHFAHTASPAASCSARCHGAR